MNPLRQLLTLILILIAGSLTLKADKTLRGKLRPSTTSTTRSANGSPLHGDVDGTDNATQAQPFDTIIAPAPHIVRLSGYDKPLSSRVESLFVTNGLDSPLTELRITLTYRDLRDRTLHQAKRHIRSDIPPGTTRRIQFPSWDTQNSFYYRNSRRPRTSGVTPYDVSCTVDTVIVYTSRPDSSDLSDKKTTGPDHHSKTQTK